MRVVSKKAFSEYFGLILNGQKTFDVRSGDFEVQPGDILKLVEIDEVRKPTGRMIRKKVGTVAHTKELESWYDLNVIAESGYVVISLLDETV